MNYHSGPSREFYPSRYQNQFGPPDRRYLAANYMNRDNFSSPYQDPNSRYYKRNEGGNFNHNRVPPRDYTYHDRPQFSRLYPPTKYSNYNGGYGGPWESRSPYSDPKRNQFPERRDNFRR